MQQILLLQNNKNQNRNISNPGSLQLKPVDVSEFLSLHKIALSVCWFPVAWIVVYATIISEQWFLKLVEALFTSLLYRYIVCLASLESVRNLSHGNSRRLLRLYEGHCLMRVRCTCVYTDALQKPGEKHEAKPTRASLSLAQPQSAAIDVSHMVVIFSMSAGSLCVWVCVCVSHHSPHFTQRSE